MSGTRHALTAQKITQKAVEMADQNGLEAVSMRKLAGALNATAMSIYNHVKGKEELHTLMLDHVINEFEHPDIDGEWKTMLKRRAVSVYAALQRHKWALTLMLTKSAPTSAILRDTDRVVGCLRNAGFSFQQVDWAHNAIESHVYGYTIQELNFPVEPDEYQSAAQHFLPHISLKEFPHAYASAKAVADGEYHGMTDFEFGLDLLIESIAAWQAKNQQAEY